MGAGVALRIAPATAKAATLACTRWHYSGCVPSGKTIRFGVWEDERFIGVVLFSRGASPFLQQRWDVKVTQLCELTRVALRDHATPVTRIVAICLRTLRKTNPDLRLVISFADPMQGHVGGIYKAGNWIYTGTSGETLEHFVRGKWRHVRSAHYEVRRRGAENVATRTCPGKHRYVYPLDDEMRERALEVAEPYPTRVRPSGEVSADQAG